MIVGRRYDIKVHRIDLYGTGTETGRIVQQHTVRITNLQAWVEESSSTHDYTHMFTGSCLERKKIVVCDR